MSLVRYFVGSTERRAALSWSLKKKLEEAYNDPERRAQMEEVLARMPDPKSEDAIYWRARYERDVRTVDLILSKRILIREREKAKKDPYWDKTVRYYVDRIARLESGEVLS